MKTDKCNTNYSVPSRSGFTLLEMVIAMALLLIPLVAVSIVMSHGQKIWQDSYNTTYGKDTRDVAAAIAAFSHWGRQSNRTNYTVYNIVSDTYEQALPVTGDEFEMIKGSAVEFRYWDDDAPTVALMDTSVTGTHYVFFYFKDALLHMDFGQVDGSGNGAILGNKKRDPDSTMVLAENLKTDQCWFAYTGGQGSVWIDLELDGKTNQILSTRTAVMPRNVWPR